MKTMRNLLAGVAVAVLAAASAQAAVNGSHHDLVTYQGTTEVCLYCHGVLDTTAATGNYGDVGELCLSRCHNQAGYVATQDVVPQRAASIDETGAAIALTYTVDAVNVTNGYAHGLNPADLLVSTTGAQVTFAAQGQALPYGTAASIQCTSCHNVHDNTNTPFLQADLFTGGPGGESFCEACHSDRGNSWVGGEAAPSGEHPVNFALILGDVGTNPGNRTNGERYGRYINLDGNIFDVASANGAALDAPGTHYTPGGKVSGFGNAAGGETFGCYTCHAVHVDANGAGWQAPNLILRDAVSADGTWNPICVGCHGDEATGVNDDNPGLQASQFYHPVGPTANAGSAGAGNVYTYTASTGNFSFDVSLAAIVSASSAGQNGISDTVVGIETTTGRPRCGSCHDVHGGINNSMVLVDLDGTRDGSFTGKVCDACHTGIGLPDVADNSGNAGEVADSHHRTTPNNWGGATFTDEGDGDTLNLDGTNSASWLTAADHANGLGCADCHVFPTAGGSTHSTAHNW